MLIGNKRTFAIECYHEPIKNTSRQVFGRMCIWAGGVIRGDIDEPACMLNVTKEHLLDMIGRVESLNDEELAHLSDKTLISWTDQFHSAHIQKDSFVKVITSFLTG